MFFDFCSKNGRQLADPLSADTRFEPLVLCCIQGIEILILTERRCTFLHPAQNCLVIRTPTASSGI